MILVCGVHGSGKTQFSKLLSEKTGLPYYSASELINKSFPLEQHQIKNTGDISFRQKVLLGEISELYKKHDDFVIDGHLCLLNQKESIEKVNINVLQSMHISKIYLIMASPTQIYERLKNRDNVLYNKEFLEDYQNEEYSYAKHLSSTLDIELHVFKSDEFENKKSILLSIKPTYAESILSGRKRFEFRKRLSKSNIDKIYLYASAPVKRIVGEVQVISKISLGKPELWTLAREYAGISKDEYIRYFQNSFGACAYKLGYSHRYSRDISLQDIGVKHAPQSYIYLNSKQLTYLYIALC